MMSLYKKIRYSINIYIQTRMINRIYAEFCIKKYLGNLDKNLDFKGYALSENILPEVIENMSLDKET